MDSLPPDVAVAVCFLHSYANPDHERAVAALVREGTGGNGPRAGFVTASCEVLPEFREYERFNTTALNAYSRSRRRDPRTGRVRPPRARRRRGRRGGASPHRAAPPAGRHGPSSGVAGPRPGAKATESPPDPEGLQPPVNSGKTKGIMAPVALPYSAIGPAGYERPSPTRVRAHRGQGASRCGSRPCTTGSETVLVRLHSSPADRRNAARCSHRPRPPPSPG